MAFAKRSRPKDDCPNRLRRLANRVLGVVLAIAAAAAPQVQYGTAAAADDKGQAAALERFDEGRKAYEAGQFEEALLAFQASAQLLPSPNTLLYIARCHRALGKIASAYTNFKMASQVAQDRLQASGEQRYRATRDTAASEAAELEANVPWLTVALPADVPAGFSVQLDGEEVPRSAWGASVPTNPGTHVVVATGERLQPFRRSFELTEGDKTRVDVLLQRLPTARLKLSFRNKPAGIAVQIDGKPVSPGELDEPRDVDIGKHVIVVRAPGYVPFTWQKSLADGEAPEVKIELKPDESARGGGTPPWLFYTAAGVGAVALGAGTYFAVSAKSDADEQRDLDPLLRDPSVRDDVKSTASAANAMFIAGGVLAAGAGVLFFTTDWSEHESGRDQGREAAGLQVSPWMGVRSAGLGAVGRF